MSGVRFFWKYLMKIRGKAAQRYRNVNIKTLNLPRAQKPRYQRKDTAGNWKEEGGPDVVLKANKWIRFSNGCCDKEIGRAHV